MLELLRNIQIREREDFETLPGSAGPACNADEICARARERFAAAKQTGLTALIAEKSAGLRSYDPPAMDRIVAILPWGRSGSLLLASYLDGHDDVLMLPELGGRRLYEFFYRYRDLPLGDKLLAYPFFDEDDTHFFDGDFAISPRQYYAAVKAILASSHRWPADFLQSRRAFVIFVHIAYRLALGKASAGRRPLIVYAQHDWNIEKARQLVEDWPQSLFIHTVRDPVSSCSGMFGALRDGIASAFPPPCALAPYFALLWLTGRDRQQAGTETQSVALRFEDLHRDPEGTMRAVCSRLEIPFQPALLDSTFNSTPYVVKKNGVAWSGRRPQQIGRQSPYLSRRDRALLYALFRENFEQWGYSCPDLFKYRIVRCAVAVSLFLVPMKTEILSAREVLKLRIGPAMRRAEIGPATKSTLSIILVRLRIMSLLIRGVFGRCALRRELLPVLSGTPARIPEAPSVSQKPPVSEWPPAWLPSQFFDRNP